MSNYVDSIRVGGADYPIDIPRLGATSEASNVQGNTAFAKIHTLGSEKTTLADIEEAVGWVGNNLFNGRSDRTGGGITVTKQTDGKYLVTGTAQSSGTVALTIGQFTAKAGVTYHLSGFPTGYTGTSSFNLALYGISTPTLYAEDRGNGATFTRNSDTRMNVVVVIPASYVCPDNFLWSPMISRNGGEYVPYHPTVQEELWDGEVSEPKNLIKYRADLPKVYTENTVTFTVNDDYSVTVNTSAPTTADVRFALTNELVNFYPDGNYVLSDVNGSNNDVYTTIWRRKQAGTAFSNLGTDGEQPCPFTVNNADKGRYLISLYIKSGKTVNNVTLYPMICTLEDWKKSHAYSPYYVPLKDVVPTKFNTFNVAPTEDGAGVSQAYSTGQYLIHNGELRKVTTAIASGAEITDNNTGSATVGGELEQINSDLASVMTYKDVTLPNQIIGNGGWSDISAHKPTVTGKTFIFAELHNYSSASQGGAVSVTGNGDYLMAISGSVVSVPVVRYFFSSVIHSES